MGYFVCLLPVSCSFHPQLFLPAMARTVEEELHEVVFCEAEDVSSLLRENPGLDVNWTDGNSYNALLLAAIRGQDDILEVLLAHPNINVNARDPRGQTLFSQLWRWPGGCC